MRARLFFAALLVIGALATASAASAHDKDAHASARAVAVRVLVPGQKTQTVAQAVAPPATLVTSGGLEYGDALVTTGAVWARARASGGARASAWAGATIRTVSIFDGEITVGAISTKAQARASASGASGALSGSWLAEVTILGEPTRAGANVRVPLADWGYVVLLEQAVVRESSGRFGRRTFVSALHVHLTDDHAGLPAGSEIVVGYAEAAASAPRPKREQPKPAPRPRAKSPAPAPPPPAPDRDPVPQPPGSRPKPPPVVQDPPPKLVPKLTAKGYVFPVYGPSSFTNDFNAPRALTGWHHGNDIFAPVGAPVLAVTEGTLFLVGWNDIGGNRLWLRDTEGNEFYYAHLSAFSPLAFNGSRVKAGDVIGFVGATGDAVGTPPHLHFEIHPAALLGLGYDGVINPYPYLLAWRRLADASFDWAGPQAGQAPPPAVILLQAEDIATASGLDPDALARALEMPALFGEGLLGPAPTVVGSAPGFAPRS